MIYFNDTAGVLSAYLPEAKTLVTLGSGSSKTTPFRSPADPQKKELGGSTEEVEFWGENNDFPQEIVKLYSKDSIIPETFLKKASMINMSDIVPFQLKGYNPDHTEILEWVNDPEINAFLENVSVKRYLKEGTLDIVWLSNAFPELVLSMDRSKVLYIQHQEAAYCRFEKKKDGVIKNVHLNANWPDVQKQDQYTVIRPLLDPYRYDRIEWVRKELEDGTFIYPINITSLARDYYQLANHDSVRTSGHLSILSKIPAYVLAMMEHEMSLKYHIKVDPRYWEQLYGGEEWRKFKQEEKRAKQSEWLKAMTAVLCDAENAGKSILTEKYWDVVNKVYNEYIEITTLADNTREGKYLKTGLNSAANIFYAIGFDPVISGFAGGSEQGDRSGGSDKRQAWMIQMHMLKPYRDPILEPIYFAAEYNGWMQKYPGLKFRYRDVIITTLDTGAQTTTKPS